MQQMSPQFAQERPPYVRFEERGFEIVDANGKVGHRLVDMALITPVGTKDLVEKVVEDWFKQMAQLERMERWDPAWTANFKNMYKMWKETNTVPTNGTPVTNWPLITKAQVAILKSANVLTVEDVALANEEAIGRMGMGGRNLVQLAKNWIESTGSAAADMAQKCLALSMTNQELIEKNKELSQRVSTLEAQVASRGSHDQATTPSSTLVDPLTLRAKQNDAADADFDKIVQ